MKIFIDTANIEEIRKANALGVICGVTTNPSLIAKEGRDFKEVIKEITSIVDGPISGEVISMQSEEMVVEAREIAKMHTNMVVKIPMCEEGLKAVSILHKEGIKTNVTLIKMYAFNFYIQLSFTYTLTLCITLIFLLLLQL